jgi:hypothetical protein
VKVKKQLTSSRSGKAWLASAQWERLQTQTVDPASNPNNMYQTMKLNLQH